jgi:hypothetical protein
MRQELRLRLLETQIILLLAVMMRLLRLLRLPQRHQLPTLLRLRLQVLVVQLQAVMEAQALVRLKVA